MTALRAPVFLDRDGTIIVEQGYLSDPDQAYLESGVVEGLTLLKALGHTLVVLTNQSGIGRGFFEERDANRVNARVAELLGEHGIEIAAWYLCPHAPGAGCDCRKPLPGMALAASRDLKQNLAGSYVIGDKQADVELADAIGATGILVATGHGREAIEWARGQNRPVFDSLEGAAKFIAAKDAKADVASSQRVRRS
jgi:D-glycero-D-manno-heptose 1,7-bisphosphate phosphatase